MVSTPEAPMPAPPISQPSRYVSTVMNPKDAEGTRSRNGPCLVPDTGARAGARAGLDYVGRLFCQDNSLFAIA